MDLCGLEEVFGCFCDEGCALYLRGRGGGGGVEGVQRCAGEKGVDVG